MTVLRRNEGTILAILEVLLYDPLFEWTKTPKKVAMRQLVNNTETSADGEKARFSIYLYQLISAKPFKSS